VPSRRISAIAIAFVFRVTRSASVTTGSPSCPISLPGGTRRKIASSGSSRNSAAIPVARKRPKLNSRLLSVGATS
jgi:hypothetical protein